MNNENFNIAPNDENEEFTVEFGEVINDGGTHDYDELDNKPQANGHTLEGNKTGEQLGLQDKINDLDTIRSGATKGATAVQPEDLARIATTGSYNDSLNKPSINNVVLTGNKSLDALGIQPKGDYALESEIPDVSNFITNTVDNLVNYYKKSETFTKQEVNDLISAITTMDVRVVQTLPTEDISTTTIYLVPKTTAGANDAYDEYIYVSNAWEHIGSTEVDLTDYVKNTDYASNATGGVLKVTNVYGTGVSASGELLGTVVSESDYPSMWNDALVSKGTLENVIEGKGLVSNTDYAGSNKAGVIKTTTYYGTGITSAGALLSAIKTYQQYQDATTTPNMFISKGTLENVIEGKGLVSNTDYAGANKAGVIRTNADYGTSITSVGALISATKTYKQYQDTTTNNMFISKGTLENVITGKGLVSNTDYATSSVGGVIKCFNSDGLNINSGTLITAVKTYAQYKSAGNWMFVGKGTLENVITGKGLDLKQLSTFDATKTQVLKNINGTLTWVDE